MMFRPTCKQSGKVCNQFLVCMLPFVECLSEYSELVFFEYLLPKNNGIEIPLFPAAYLIIVLFSKSTKLVNIFIHVC